MNLTLDPAALTGMALAMTRVGAFATASPFTKSLTVPGRLAFTLAVGWALATPVATAPAMSGLIASVAVNIGIGWMIGFLTGILIKAFETAGALVDLAGGLNASQVFDPLTGTQNAVLAKLFNLTAIALWFVLGGDRLMVEGLAATVKAVPLDGLIRLSDGLLPLAVNLVGSMLQAAVELGLPALAALFVAEVTFGLAAKFAPQANVFAIGLPVKLVAALATVGFVVAGFPSAVSVSIDSIREITITAIKGLGG